MKSLFLTLWAASHLVYFYAFTYSDMPNQIHYVYTGTLVALGAVGLLKFSPLTQRGGLELIGLVVLYVGALWVVSLWEVFPGAAEQYFKFEALHIAVAFNAYVVGRIAQQRKLLTTHAVLGLVLMAVTVAQILLDRDQSRYGYGYQLMLCLGAMLMLGWRWMAAAALMVIFASLHKTPLASALVGVMVILWKTKMPPATGNKYVRAIIQPLLGAVLIGCAAVVMIPYMGPMVERLMPENLYFYGLVGEQQDPYREYTHRLSTGLLPEYWIRGMGYMNFLALTEAEATVVYAYDRFGEAYYGSNLHNSYMTWALEGGLLVCSVVALIFWRSGKRIRFIWKAERDMGVLLAAWCAAALLLGWFHQVHSTVQFWSILGIIFGYRDQLADRLVRSSSLGMPLAQTMPVRSQPEGRIASLPARSR